MSVARRYASMDVGVLLQQLENTPGVVVLVTNKVCSAACGNSHSALQTSRSRVDAAGRFKN